ncbi:MAG: ATP-binding protein [bacterium]|nr:ATP-binding protein [bacterium]
MRIEQYEFLTRLPLLLNSSLKQSVVISRSLKLAREELQAEAATVFLSDSEKNELIFWATGEDIDKSLAGQRIPAGQGIVGWVIENQKIEIVNDVATDPRFFSNMDKKSGFTTKNMVCVPLTVAGTRKIGAIQVLNKTNGNFNSDDSEFVERLAAQVALAIENARLFESLQLQNQKLEKLDRRKGEMISVITHEFRTPFSLIQTSADILKSGMLKDENSRKQIYDTLIEGTSRLTRLLSEMKNLGLTSSSSLQLKKQRIAIPELFDELKETYSAAAAGRNMYLKFDCPCGNVTIMGDRVNLLVAIGNLIANAIRFTRDQGQVTVSCRQLSNKFLISVADTGIGIPAAEQPMIFEKFYEVRDHLNHNSGTFEFNSGGLGLGLATVKAVIEAHGSSVTLVSEEGKGSEFSFTLESC